MNKKILFKFDLNLLGDYIKCTSGYYIDIGTDLRALTLILIKLNWNPDTLESHTDFQNDNTTESNLYHKYLLSAQCHLHPNNYQIALPLGAMAHWFHWLNSAQNPWEYR